LRARNIKPGFFENEELAELSFECRLLYIGLWCYADREGRFEWRLKRIKALIFPYDLKLDIEKMLNVMTCKGHVMTYNCNGKKYGFLPTFKNHNNPHPHEAKSKCPDPKNFIKQTDNNNVIKCNDMSMECNADIMNPDIMNPDIMNPDIMNPDEKKSSKKFADNSDEIKLSKLLFNLIKKRNPSHLEPDLQKWAYEIDKMIRLDKRNPKKIEEVIQWCQADDFWQNNILSTKKLRNQYDQLILKMPKIKSRDFDKWISGTWYKGKWIKEFLEENKQYISNPEYQQLKKKGEI